MPLNPQDGTYEPRDIDEIREFIYADLDDRLDEDPEALDSAVLRSYVDALAATIAEQQEQALQDVHDAAFIDSAEADDLEAVADLVAAQRRETQAATGIQHFSARGRVDQDFTISAGTTVQTSDGSITFDTERSRTLTFFDGFERLNPLLEYSGDTGAFTRSEAFSAEGEASLKGKSSSVGKITKDGSTFVRGDELRATIRNLEGGAGPDRATIVYHDNATEQYQATVDFPFDELRIAKGGATKVTKPIDGGVPLDTALELHIDTRINGDHFVRLYDGGTKIAEVTFSEQNPKTFAGKIGFRTNNGETFYDDVAHHRVATDITANTAGTVGNVGKGSLTVMPNPPAGVNSTTNPIPTGDSRRLDTSGTTLVRGEDIESDAEFRTRITEDSEQKQNPILRRVSNLPTVTSVEIFTNTSDATDAEGRPGKSFEVVVPSNADFVDVAEAIFEEKAFTSNAVGGFAGTSQTQTVTAFNGQEFDVNFSSAPVTDIGMTLSIVVDETYDGDDALRRRVVDYIGGIRPDGNEAVGTDIGEGIYVDQIREAVTDDDGVIGFDDTNTSFTPSTTTNANGLTIIDIASMNIGEVDGTDGSIVINKTQL
jgi:uncharacterized phage protein gp47/JayE